MSSIPADVKKRLDDAKAGISPFQAAIDSIGKGMDFSSALASAGERDKLVTSEQIEDFTRHNPDIANGHTRSQIFAMIIDEREFPQGQIGPHDRGFIASAGAAPAELAGALQREAFNQAANIFQTQAVIADLFGLPDLAGAHRQIAEGTVRFGEETGLGRLSRESLAATTGGIIGGIVPTVAGIVTGLQGVTLAYYAIQGFGSTGAEYDTVLKERGLSPDEIDRFLFAVGGGAIEVLTEMLPLHFVGKKLGPSLRKSIGDAFLRGKPGAIANILFKAEIISDIEVIEETIGNFASNAMAANGIPFIVDGFDPDRSIAENWWPTMKHAKIGGLIVAGAAPFSPARLKARRLSQNVLTQAEQDFLRRAFAGDSRPATEPFKGKKSVALPIISPKPVVDPAIDQMVSDMDEGNRAEAEDAALEVIEDEGAAPEAKERARQIIDAIDETTATPAKEDDGKPKLEPVTFVGEQKPGEGSKLPSVVLVNNERGDTITFDPSKHEVIGVAEAAAEEGTTLPGRFLKPGAVTTPKQRQSFLERLGIATRRKDKPTVTEKQALKASLRAQKRVAEIVSRNITRKLKSKEKSTKAADKKMRKLVRKLIRSVVSRKRQGTMLRQVEGATPGTLQTILHEIDAVVAKDRIDEQLADARRMKKVIKKARRISNEARGLILEHIEEAEGRAKGDFGQIKSLQDRTAAMRKIAGEMNKDLNIAADLFVDEIAANTELVEGVENEIAKNVNGVVANIGTAERPPLSPDKKTKNLQKGIIEISDVRNLTRNLEGKHDDTSILERLLWRNMTRAHEAHDTHMRRRTRQIEAAAKRAGFESLADAMAQLSGKGGEGVTLTVEIVIDGKPTTVPMGLAMWFVAIDAETEALLNEGAPVVTREGLKQKGTVVSEEDLELDQIRAQVPQNLQDFVAELKLIADQDTDQLMDVLLELNGRQPRRVDNYFRRRRNLDASARKGLPVNFKEALIMYNENLGFTREREGGTASSIVVEDFITVIIEQINDTSKVVNIARPIRDASSVLLNPNVQTAINNKFGKHMADALLIHLGAASLARRERHALSQLIHAISGNVAAAKLGLNPTSILRQLGGIPRLAPTLGVRGMQEGLRGALSVTMHEMTSNSGYFWDRYVSNITGRFGPVEEGNTFGKDRSGLSTTLDRAARNILVGDVAGAYLALRDISLSTLEILNFFDGINARIAWAAYDAQVRREHTDWSRQKQLEWIAEKASDAIRDTQNSSSPLDLSTVAIRSKGNIFSLWLAFSSDRVKTANRVRRAMNRSASDGIQAVVAESANIIWSVGVGSGMTLAVRLFVAFTFGDEDDVEEALRNAVRLDKLAYNFAFEAINMIDPIATNRLIEINLWHQADIFDTPAGASLNDFVQGIGRIGKAGLQMTAGEQEAATTSFLKGLRDVGMEAGTLSGLNPGDSTMRRIFRAYDKLDDDEQARTISGR